MHTDGAQRGAMGSAYHVCEGMHKVHRRQQNTDEHVSGEMPCLVLVLHSHFYCPDTRAKHGRCAASCRLAVQLLSYLQK